MMTGVELVTAVVLTVKFALVAPAARVTVEGTLAAPLSLESCTCAPPVGAGPLNVAVPVEDSAPPVTVAGVDAGGMDAGGGSGDPGRRSKARPLRKRATRSAKC